MRNSPKPTQFCSIHFALANSICQTSSEARAVKPMTHTECRKWLCKLPVDTLKYSMEAAGKQILKGQTYRPTNCILLYPVCEGSSCIHLCWDPIGLATPLASCPPVCAPRELSLAGKGNMNTVRASLSRIDFPNRWMQTLLSLLTTPPTHSLPSPLSNLCNGTLCHARIRRFHKGTDFLYPLAQLHHPSLFTEFPTFFSSPFSRRNALRIDAPVSSLSLCTEHLL